MQRPVAVSTASAVEAVAHCLARGGRHWSHAAQKGEGRLALEPLRVVSDGGLGHQPRDLPLQIGDLLGESSVATRNGPYRQLGVARRSLQR